MPNDTIRFKFSMFPGDLIYALAGMKQICQRLQCTAEIYLGLNIEWAMGEEMKEGRLSNITLTEKTMELLRPLLMSQPWISKVESFEAAFPAKYNDWCEAFKTMSSPENVAKWYNEHRDDIIDLDRHQLLPLNLQYSIARSNFYVYHDMTANLGKAWLDVPIDPSFSQMKPIVINRTKRVQNKSISYKFLKQYEDRLLFVGHQDEWVDLCTAFDLEIAFHKITDFKDLAITIKSASFFIGNQSLAFAIAEALKVPRVLEVCEFLPNVIPCGDKAYDFYFQSSFEGIVRDLAEPNAGYKGDQYSQIE